ncbi:COG3014 family protein [Flavobacterium sp. JP2137]|uniref:COG3014 family protein n=1 Tax=Flavobacterium sp. JP2137 TaxID=3414510 RepID=UPI003D300BBD
MIYQRGAAYILRTSALVVLMFFAFSCATYHDRITAYYQSVSTGDLAQADKALEKNALLKKPRNKLLYLMEKGRVAHLNGDYTNSNKYFNEADLLVEIGLKSTSDAVVGAVLNPMSQNYKGEDFEIFMLHYYKALNYLYLGQTQEALVEARRITLQNQSQGDKFNEKNSRYTKDAFSLILQGLIYEQDNDYNNAFIAYRNAVEVFQSSEDHVYYGVALPENLKYDVMRMASKVGFVSELQKFEKQFNSSFKDYEAPAGELVVFWENGIAPVKIQKDLVFTLVKGSNGSLFFTDVAGGLVIPFDFSIGGGGSGLDAVHSLRVAYPDYVSRPLFYNSAQITGATGGTFKFEKVEDINQLAVQTLNERFAKEMGVVLTRLAIKKGAEYALSSSAKSSDGNNAVLEGLGIGMQLYNMISEKADTRNWQTLPSQINYVRVPLQPGINEIEIDLTQANGQKVKDQIKIEANGKLQFYNYSTLK